MVTVNGVSQYLFHTVSNDKSSTTGTNVTASTVSTTVSGDIVELSTEALEMSSEDDLEEISFKEYLSTFSDLGKYSFWAALKSKTKPSYFIGAEAYNANVAAQAAEKLVTEAANQGFDLDLDETKNFIERKCLVDIENNIDEAVEMGWIASPADDGLDLELIQVADYLTDEDKTILEAMYMDAEKNGFDTDQVDWLAMKISLERYFSRDNPGQGPDSLDKDYLEQLLDSIRNGGNRMFSAETIEHFIANIDSYDASTA